MGKNTKKCYDLLVIGAGASGMMAAIIAARENKKVAIIEKLDKAGKKILATGNGKCNFTNNVMHLDCFYGEKEFIDQILKNYTVDDCLAFFRSIGVYPKQKNGYYYPNSEQASSVTNALLFELERLGVKMFFETNVQDINPSNSTVNVDTNKGQFMAKHVVIATGLLASPKLGSDGSMFDVIKSLGHRFQPVLPVLCGFYCKGMNFKQVSGVRAHGTVEAYVDGIKLAMDTGEIQFTDYGLSGIPVFQISHHLSKGLYAKKLVEIKMNLLPDFDASMILDELNLRCKLGQMLPVNTLLNGLINQKLADMIIDKAGIKSDIYISALSDSQISKIAKLLQGITVTVTNYRDFEFAQVCTGGISTGDVNPVTLESKLASHVHFTGEILDVDGICGGYNLHFAWATGYMAGKAASQE